MKAVVHGRHATCDLSSSLAMGALGSQRKRIEKNVPVDLEQHMSDSDEVNGDDSNDQTQLTVREESRSPARSVHTNARKRRSEGGSLGDRRQSRIC